MFFVSELTAHSLAVSVKVLDIVIERECVHDAVMLLAHFECVIATKVSCSLSVGELIAFGEFCNDGYNVL